ncbi:response regulator [Thermodesulfobacteriota bacterium]
MPTKILIVEDHPLFRQGLRQLLEKEKDLQVVGEAGDGRAAVEMVQKHSPDMVVMDINMPEMDGIEATRLILSEFPKTRVVALSVHSEKQFVRDMIKAGASGYILKESVPEEMIRGIRTVLAGDVYLSSSISDIVVSEYRMLLSDAEHTAKTASEPILRTKLHRPPVSADIIPRPRLIRMLEEGRQRAMTLISAPAGYGKSMVASQWLAAYEGPGAWVSLDEGDNDLRLFLTYLLAAIHDAFPEVRLASRSLLQAAELPPVKVMARFLLNDLDEAEEPLILVLDDYHRISNAAVNDLLGELLQHPSPMLHLMLISRRDPLLPIGSLRARGLLSEMTMAHLRFTSQETSAFLARILRVPIGEDEATVLDARMEGWVTGLRLAALSLGQKEDVGRVLQGLKEENQYVADYLIQEVLSGVPPVMARYLMVTSILDRFCAPLCDKLSLSPKERKETKDQLNGEAFIDWLKETNLFVVPLDQQNHWFRYHHLFQELLKKQLEQNRNAQEIATLHSSAGEWFESKGLIEEAIKHSLAAGNPVHAAEIIEQHRYDETNQDRWYVIGWWLGLLPPEIIQQRPALLLTKAWQRFNQFRLLEIPPLLDQAKALLGDETADESLLGELDFHWGYLSIWVEGDGEAALKRLENARNSLPETHQELVAETEFDIALARHMIGEGESVIDSLTERIRTTISHDDMLKTRLVGAQVFIHLMSGDLMRALTAAQEMRAVAKEGGNTHVVGWSDYILALTHLQSYRLDEALQSFRLVVEVREVLHRKAAVEALVGLVLTYQAMGRTDEAVDAMKQLLEFAQETADPQHVAVAESCQARLELLQGDSQSADRSRLFDAEPHAPGAAFWLEVPLITQGRIRIAAGTRKGLELALESLGVLRQQGIAIHFTCLVIEIAVLQSVALEKLGRTDEALKTLEDVVGLARPGGWIRPFVEAGPPMADLLKGLLSQDVDRDYIEKILDSFRKYEHSLAMEEPYMPGEPPEILSPQPLDEPLTNRELQVLELLARRYQNKEIAEELFIAIETVKTHLNNIYQKLDVNNRRQAVEKAKALGVLSLR